MTHSGQNIAKKETVEWSKYKTFETEKEQDVQLECEDGFNKYHNTEGDNKRRINWKPFNKSIVTYQPID